MELERGSCTHCRVVCLIGPQIRHAADMPLDRRAVRCLGIMRQEKRMSMNVGPLLLAFTLLIQVQGLAIAADCVGVSYRLEGCRNNGTITLRMAAGNSFVRSRVHDR